MAGLRVQDRNWRRGLGRPLASEATFDSLEEAQAAAREHLTSQAAGLRFSSPRFGSVETRADADREAQRGLNKRPSRSAFGDFVGGYAQPMQHT